MRTAIFGILLGLAPLPAAAATPVGIQPLATNEVLLEISAMGSVTSRADLATLTAVVGAIAPTQDDARRQADSREAALRAALAAAGVPPDEIRVRPASLTDDATSLVFGVQALENAGSGAEGEWEQESDHRVFEVRVRDFSRLDAIQRAFRDSEARQTGEPSYELVDDGPSRREARARALASVRADAEAYASSLGMRVVRIVRVTERVGLDMMTFLVSQPSLPRRMRSMGSNHDPEIETMVIVGVDFVLAPQ